MKHTTLRTFALLGLFVMLAAASVSAQTTGQMRANIPFDFVAGQAKLKAGEYTIRRSSEKILVLRGVNDTKNILVFAPYTVQRPERDLSGKLVFNRYGDQYFLAATWPNGQPIGSELGQSSGERRLARELAKAKTRPQSVEIVARAN